VVEVLLSSSGAGLWGARRRGQNHRMSLVRVAAARLLPWLFALYAAATLLHFAHNAHYLALYPNLPPSWSSASVYAAWGVVTALGVLGFALYATGARRPGRSLLGLYALLGFGGLLHYIRAPLAHHSATMNVTIWAEAAAAALLLVNVLMLGGGATTRSPCPT